MVLSKTEIPRPTGDWDFELSCVSSNRKGKSAAATLLQLALTFFVYMIWREHNAQIFQSTSALYVILALIWSLLKVRVASLPVLAAKTGNLQCFENRVH